MLMVLGFHLRVFKDFNPDFFLRFQFQFLINAMEVKITNEKYFFSVCLDKAIVFRLHYHHYWQWLLKRESVSWKKIRVRLIFIIRREKYFFTICS